MNKPLHVDYMEVDLPVRRLEVGMHVVALDRPWSESTFLMQGFVIKNDTELFRLHNQCNYVTIQIKKDLGARLKQAAMVEMTRLKLNEKGRRAREEAGTDPANLRKVYHRNSLDFDRAVEESYVTFESARKLTAKIMSSVKAGRSLSLKDAKFVVTRVVDSVLKNSEALRFLSQIKHIDQYTVEHCMNCCVLAAVFAKHLGLTVQDIEQAAMAGLLHDIGKSKIPAEILHKKGKLNKEEAMLMSKHAEFGWQILMSTPNGNAVVAEAAYSHHEREDGLGYPRHLHTNEISLFTKIVTLVDCYDAMTSRRCYGKVHSSSNSMEIIRMNSGRQFDTALVMEFVKCIGEYPPGCLVEMTNGEVGIVVSSLDEFGAFPKVLLVRDSQHREHINNRIVNLRTGDVDSNSMPYEILSELPSGAFGVEIKQYLRIATQVAQAN